MQEDSGEMRLLLGKEIEKEVAKPSFNPNKLLHTGMYFKIKQTYFKISNITAEGIAAKGVSRKEFFRNRR